MNSSETEIERLRRHERIAWDHVVAFKGLLHGTQDEIDERDRRIAECESQIKRLRKIIAKLEDRLGVDQEL